MSAQVKGKDDVGATMDFMDLEREKGVYCVGPDPRTHRHRHHHHLCCDIHDLGRREHQHHRHARPR